jgi:hypothetical protein
MIRDMHRLVLACLLVVAVPAAADPKPDVKLLAADRVSAAAKALELAQRQYAAGVSQLDDIYRWSVRLLDATLDGARGKAIAAALKEHADRMHALEEVVKTRVSAGIASPYDSDETAYYIVEADLWVARGKK